MWNSSWVAALCWGLDWWNNYTHDTAERLPSEKSCLCLVRNDMTTHTLAGQWREDFNTGESSLWMRMMLWARWQQWQIWSMETKTRLDRGHSQDSGTPSPLWSCSLRPGYEIQVSLGVVINSINSCFTSFANLQSSSAGQIYHCTRRPGGFSSPERSL